jgi:hypothetical protein
LFLIRENIGDTQRTRNRHNAACKWRLPLDGRGNLAPSCAPNGLVSAGISEDSSLDCEVGAGAGSLRISAAVSRDSAPERGAGSRRTLEIDFTASVWL